MKVLKVMLNVLHFIYCAVYITTLDLPFMFGWEWYWKIVYYVATTPLFIWGIKRLIDEVYEIEEEIEDNDRRS